MVICVGDDGHYEIETICLPSCDNNEIACETDVSNNRHAEHNECSNCSDFEIDYLLSSTRFQDLSSYLLSNLDLNVLAIAGINIAVKEYVNTQLSDFYLVYGQSPPSHSIETTILRC